MNSRRRFWDVVLGAAATAFAALGYFGAGAWGLPSRTNQDAPQPALATVAAKDKCACPSQQGGDCCGNDGFACGAAHRSDAALANIQLVQADKPEMRASPQAMAKGVTARRAIREHQQTLSGDGVYRCCIKPGCTFCSTAADMCPCAMNLSKGGPVCPECWGGWSAGQGRLPDIDPAKVQVIPMSKLKMMYKMKAMNFDKAAAPVPANPK